MHTSVHSCFCDLGEDKERKKREKSREEGKSAISRKLMNIFLRLIASSLPEDIVVRGLRAYIDTKLFA